MFVPVHAVILDCDSNDNGFETFSSAYANINLTTGLVEGTYGMAPIKKQLTVLPVLHPFYYGALVLWQTIQW